MRLEPLYILPLASAAVWMMAAFAPFPRGRPQTPTETALCAFLAILGVWALLDAIVLQTSDRAVALVLVHLRDAVASIGGLSLLFFAKWSTRGRSLADVVFVVPVVMAVAAVWVGTTAIEVEAWGPRSIRNVPLFFAWFAQSFVYVIASLVSIAPGLRALWRQDRPVALRGLSVVVATGIATLLAISTNIVMSLTGSTAPPPFSSLLVIPGGTLLAAALIAPIPRSRIVHALHRMVLSFDRDLLGAAILGDDGAVFGIAMQKPRDDQQSDLPEVMVAVQQFLVGSPRGPPPASLRVPLGDVNFLVRRTSGVTLVVALRGRPHDFLASAVEETLARLKGTPDLLPSAQNGSIPAMRSIQAVLRDLIPHPWSVG